MQRVIYMDSHATTPVDPEVFETMRPYFTDMFGNASSTDHEYGSVASEAVSNARKTIAGRIGADDNDIIFTSGATESDNLALKGVMNGDEDHLITCSTEHKAVLDVAKRLERSGTKVTYLPVDETGLVDPEDVHDAITDRTTVISIMAANNEVGTLADICEIGKIAHDHNVLFHMDAAQAVGHVPIDVDRMNVDLMSFSSHKIYGPKGIGALYIRGIMPRVRVMPMFDGGGQERKIRSGTLNVPGIVGFAKAVDMAHDSMDRENRMYLRWTDRLLGRLADAGAVLNGHPTQRLPHNLNVRFEGIDGKAIINSVSDRLAISAGSACTTQTVEPSHVLLAMGMSEEQAHSSIRIGCGRFNTDDDIDIATERICNAVILLTRIR